MDVNNVINHINDDLRERTPPNDENPPTRDDISSHDDDVRPDTLFMDWEFGRNPTNNDSKGRLLDTNIASLNIYVSRKRQLF
ncbi:hypothetical protein DPMN_083155 [Dreissena polymorpha]|uniref:Uncharacterized protein n=1 Tax=Dreissena polymorpha TaxID=45954 RepID=A0A9D3Y9E9_DREPO|nr:hypothetical protein DPMN_083155 [Dreissena polymorpha]